MTNQPQGPAGDPHDLLAGYLLDALDRDETTRFLEHLPACGTCRDELAMLTDTVADLAAANHVHPPTRVEDALMTSLFGDPMPDSRADGGQATVPTVPGAEPVAISSRRRRWMWPAAAAAAFLLGAGLVATTGILSVGSDDAQVVADGEAQLILEVTSAPDAHFMPLDVPQGTAKLVVSDAMDMGAVMASDLPMPASGREYHVWTVMGDGSMASAATFTPDSDGHASVMLRTGVHGATGFMLTVEDPGAQHPSGEPLAEVAI